MCVFGTDLDQSPFLFNITGLHLSSMPEENLEYPIDNIIYSFWGVNIVYKMPSYIVILVCSGQGYNRTLVIPSRYF